MKIILIILVIQTILAIITTPFLIKLVRILSKEIRPEENKKKEVYKPNIQPLKKQPKHYIIHTSHFGNSTVIFDECPLISKYDIDYIFLIEYPDDKLVEMVTGIDIKFPTDLKINFELDRLSNIHSSYDQTIKVNFDKWSFHDFNINDYTYIYSELESFINSQNAEFSNKTQ